MKKDHLSAAIDKLADDFIQQDWQYISVEPGNKYEKMFRWPGAQDEEIMVCVHKGLNKGNPLHEMFHRQDFFFFNYAYKGNYEALSYKYDNKITVHEGECYIGQPYAGYALHLPKLRDIIIIGIMMRKETFFRSFLPILSSDAKLFHFFLGTRSNEFSDEFIRLKFSDSSPVRQILEIMMVEYAHPQEDTQAILKSLTLTLLMQVAREYRHAYSQDKNLPLSEQIVQYMNEHTDAVSLKDISSRFSYHPNYISALLRRELGRTFSEILLELRMEKAITLLRGTDLSIEEIAYMLGYSNSSNFYKAFREYYHQSPRDFISSIK